MVAGSRTLTGMPARLGWSDISARSTNAAVSWYGDVLLLTSRQVHHGMLTIRWSGVLICVPIVVIAEPPAPQGALARA